MSGLDADAERLVVYALRLQERAVRDINAIQVEIAELISPVAAQEWQVGLRQAIASLATSPRRCALVPEKFRRETRHLLYRRSESRVVYRILFVTEGDDMPDLAKVTVLHVRHAAARPITRAQMRVIEAGE